MYWSNSYSEFEYVEIVTNKNGATLCRADILIIWSFSWYLCTCVHAGKLFLSFYKYDRNIYWLTIYLYISDMH